MHLWVVTSLHVLIVAEQNNVAESHDWMHCTVETSNFELARTQCVVQILTNSLRTHMASKVSQQRMHNQVSLPAQFVGISWLHGAICKCKFCHGMIGVEHDSLLYFLSCVRRMLYLRIMFADCAPWQFCLICMPLACQHRRRLLVLLLEQLSPKRSVDVGCSNALHVSNV